MVWKSKQSYNNTMIRLVLNVVSTGFVTTKSAYLCYLTDVHKHTVYGILYKHICFQLGHNLQHESHYYYLL